jgi:hypothetical protein
MKSVPRRINAADLAGAAARQLCPAGGRGNIPPNNRVKWGAETWGTEGGL